MNTLERVVFAAVFVFAMVFFLRNVYRLFAMVCLGRWENRFDHLAARVKGMLWYAFAQRRVVSERYGVNHLLIFWGFLCLLAINAQFLVAGLFPEFSFAFLGHIPYGVILLVTDLMSVVVLAAVIVAVVRRIGFRPEHIDFSFDPFFILGLIGTLMVAYFGLHACEIALNGDPMTAWVPVSATLAKLAGDPDATHAAVRVFWWIHALALLVFLNYLPYSKHLHVLTAIPNCFFRSFDFVTTAPRVIFERGRRFGISKVVQFTWKDLLDFLSCTECGRCQAACPAHNTEKPLNPKQVVHDGKLNLFANGKAVLASRPCDSLAAADENAAMPTALIGNGDRSVSNDAIWSCTTCGACMAKCPVFIEHVPKLIAMRRHLTMEQSDFPQELITLFENSEQRANPWGVPPADRAKWTQDLDVNILAENGKVDYLFFVGCAGAFDPRNRQTTLAIVKILQAAGLSWGILGTEEQCCGDSLRRLGNEYVFDKLVRENIATFEKYGVRRIITQCPHCFSSLKNDYKQFGADLQVIHHSQLISQLIRENKIALKGRSNGKVVIHDSCYLGRHNDIYDQPRDIVKAACGAAPGELDRHGEDGFCCGAGGGRMWMEENLGRRINTDRTREALKQNPAAIAVACPYCMTMFEDGVKDEHKQDTVRVKDVAEIVADAMT